MSSGRLLPEAHLPVWHPSGASSVLQSAVGGNGWIMPCQPCGWGREVILICLHPPVLSSVFLQFRTLSRTVSLMCCPQRPVPLQLFSFVFLIGPGIGGGGGRCQSCR